MMRLSSILQALSPAVAPGSDYPEARPGDFMLAFEDSSERLVPRVPGVTFVPVAAIENAVEWPPERGTRSAPIDHHDFVPWTPNGWTATTAARPVGGRTATGLKRPSTCTRWSTASRRPSPSSRPHTASGRSFSRDADKVRVKVDSEIVRVCGARWRMTSELERKKGYTWYGPRFTKLGVLGEQNGPSLELVRKAKTMRFEIKLDEVKRKAERAALSGVTPYAGFRRAERSPSLRASSARARGPIRGLPRSSNRSRRQARPPIRVERRHSTICQA